MTGKNEVTQARSTSLCLFLILLLCLSSFVGGVAIGAPDSAKHFKMISTVEYFGKGQYSSQFEDLFTVDQKLVSEDVVGYSISSGDLADELSFVVDRGANEMSEASGNSAFYQQVTNLCAEGLNKVSAADAGKTWKQEFDLSSLAGAVPSKLSFTLTAMQVENSQVGEMIAVRSLSEPFYVNSSAGRLTCRANSIYVFDKDVEEVLLSVSTFESATTANGYKEVLLNQIVTSKTDAAGNSVELKGLGSEFEKFVAKLSLTKQSNADSKTEIPLWAQTTGLKAAQISEVCSSVACEGALNPVTMVTIPALKVIDFQTRAATAAAGEEAAAAGVGPWEWLVGEVGFWPAAAIVGAGIAIPIAASGSSSSSSASP